MVVVMSKSLIQELCSRQMDRREIPVGILLRNHGLVCGSLV
jgi:hypothetical protein